MPRPSQSTYFARLLPTMFQRRLALLLAITAAGMLVLGAKVTHLTVVRGADLRDQAEARLVRHLWMPTVRGKILDRKGRVLARDRAGYDLGIEYPVLSGEWAADCARDFVRRAYREEWTELEDGRRSALIETARAAFQSHADASREELALLAGISGTALAKECDAVVERVRRMADAQRRRNRDRQLAEASERNEVVTAELYRSIESRAAEPIREERSAHRLGIRVPDETAFRAQHLLAEEATIFPIPGETDARFEARVPRLPGVRLFDTGEREYPLERIAVEINRSTFPSAMTERSTLPVLAEGVGARLIGWMRDDALREDTDARAAFLAGYVAEREEAEVRPAGGDAIDRGEYRPGDRVGGAGLERGMEHGLRGLRGFTTRHIDTGEATAIAPRAGRDVTTTLDIMLQARVQAIMSPEAGLARVHPWHRGFHDGAFDPPAPTMPDGTPIHGAAVVLDIDSGEVLAMVSTPEVRRSDLDALLPGESLLWDPVAMPMRNRCIERPYPPGSIVKPLILAGAVTAGVHTLEQPIACNGHLLPGNENLFRCWIFKRTQQGERLTHSQVLGRDLAGPEAIEVSCNVYFFTLGKKLGFDGITDVYRAFGLGSRWNLGVGREFAGDLGERVAPDELAGHAILMGIGQGAVSWTPLHAAAAYATLARYGYVVAPTVVKGTRAPEPRDLRLDSRAVAAAIEGLRRSVNEQAGTGHHLTFAGGVREPIFNAPGVEVWGKTGTAQAPNIYASAAPTSEPPDEKPTPSDSDGENPTPPARARRGDLLREGDHSWFVVLVGPEGDRPRFAISVMMEYAGSGGKVSGPVCNQIIHALIAEGYL